MDGRKIPQIDLSAASLRGARVLIVGSNRHDSLESLFSDAGAIIQFLDAADDFMATARLSAPDAILLDISSRDDAVYSACAAFLGSPDLGDTPVIVIEQSGDALDRGRVFEAGASDYLAHPFEPQEALVRISRCVALRRLRLEHRREQEQDVSESRHRDILETMQEGYYESDLAGNITFVNAAQCEILGYGKDKIIGINNRALTDEETAKQVYQTFNAVYQTGTPARVFDWEIIRPDGSSANIEISVNLKRNAAGEPAGFWGITRDITERKRLEQALRQGEEKYRNILETMHDGYYESDLFGNHTFFNRAHLELSGYTADELMGMNYADYMDAETFSRVTEEVRNVYQARGMTDILNWEIIRKDGSRRTIEMSLGLRYAPSGKPIGFCGVTRDITERKRTEEALRISEQKYRDILDTMQESYYENDLHGNHTFFNRAGIELLGYSEEELMGMNFRDYTDEETANEVYRQTHEVFVTGKPRRAIQWEIRRSDGQKRLIEMSVALRYGSDGSPIGFRGVSRDITERRKADEERLQLKLQQERVRILTSFIEDASHEFRTPLATIRTNIYLLGRTQDKVKQASRLSLMQDEVDNITRLVEDLVTVSRLDSGAAFHFHRAHIAATIEGVVSAASVQAKIQGVAFSALFDDELPAIALDAEQICTAVEALLKNALQHTGAGDEVYLKAYAEGDCTIIEVADTGSGMDDETLMQIFDRFYRADSAHSTRGFGLGLTIAQKIIDAHAGRITVDSEPGHGSRFKIWLPVERSDQGDA